MLFSYLVFTGTYICNVYTCQAVGTKSGARRVLTL